MDYRDKDYEKKVKNIKSSSTKSSKEPGKKGHIFRKIFLGLSILGAVGATEELTRVGAGHNWDWGKAYGMGDKAEAKEETVTEKTAVKIGDQYYEIVDGKKTGDALIFEGVEDGATSVEVWEDEKGAYTGWNLIGTAEVLRGFTGGYTKDGEKIDPKGLENGKVCKIGDTEFLVTIKYIAATDDKGAYYVNGGKKVYFETITKENDKYFADGIEIVAENGNNGIFEQFVKQAEQDPAPETPVKPETPGDEEQKDPETPETPTDPTPENPDNGTENPGESNAVEGQDKNVTYSDVDALKQLNANLAKILASKDFFKGKEVTEASVEVLDLDHGMLVFSATVDGVKLNYSTTLNMNDKVNDLDKALADVVMNKVVTVAGKDNAVNAINTFDTNMVSSNFHEVTPITLSLKDKDGKNIDNTVYLMKSNRVQGNAYQQLYSAYVGGKLYQFQIQTARKDMDNINAILQNNLQQFINEGESDLLKEVNVKVVEGWLLHASPNVVVTVEVDNDLEQ